MCFIWLFVKRNDFFSNPYILLSKLAVQHKDSYIKEISKYFSTRIAWSYVCDTWHDFNPFPHIDAFWRLCSKRLFENIMTKGEIAQNEQFLFLPQLFHFLVISYPFNYRDFLFFYKICSKSSAAELSYEGKG